MGESGLAAVRLCRNDGYAASAESRFISARAGETSAILPGTTPSVHQVERTWNGVKCVGCEAMMQDVFQEGAGKVAGMEGWPRVLQRGVLRGKAPETGPQKDAKKEKGSRWCRGIGDWGLGVLSRRRTLNGQGNAGRGGL